MDDTNTTTVAAVAPIVRTVAHIDNNELVGFNDVYVAPGDELLANVYIVVGRCVFMVKPSDGVAAGCIALDNKQRQSTGAHIGDLAECKGLVCVDSIPSIIEFHLHSWPHTNKQRIMSQIFDHVFVDGQRFYTAIDGKLVTCKIEFIRGRYDVGALPMGRITSETSSICSMEMLFDVISELRGICTQAIAAASGKQQPQPQQQQAEKQQAPHRRSSSRGRRGHRARNNNTAPESTGES